MLSEEKAIIELRKLRDANRFNGRVCRRKRFRLLQK